MKPTSLLFLSLLIVTGCAAPRIQTQPMQTSRTFDATKAQVWPLVVAEVSQNYPVKVVEKDSGLITTDFVQMPVGINNNGQTQWIYNPDFFLATWSGLRMSMNVLVNEAQPGKTTVNIRTHFEALEHNVTKSWTVCRSNGNLENSMLDHITVAFPH